MRKFGFRLFLAAIGLITCLSSCKKSHFENAAFHCKINGTAYWLDQEQIAVSVTGNQNIYIKVSALNTSSGKSDQQIILDFQGNSGEITPLNSSNTFQWFNNASEFRSISNDPGILHIEQLDTIEHRISGTFNLTAYGRETNSTATISDGSFNLQW